jgi:hypothetical protein
MDTKISGGVCFRVVNVWCKVGSISRRCCRGNETTLAVADEVTRENLQVTETKRDADDDVVVDAERNAQSDPDAVAVPPVAAAVGVVSVSRATKRTAPLPLSATRMPHVRSVAFAVPLGAVRFQGSEDMSFRERVQGPCMSEVRVLSCSTVKPHELASPICHLEECEGDKVTAKSSSRPSADRPIWCTVQREIEESPSVLTR